MARLMGIFERQTTGSVVCTSCGKLVAVKQEVCWNCGRRNPGLWGFAPLLRRLGEDLGFSKLVIVSCTVLYVVSLVLNPPEALSGGFLGFLAPQGTSLFLLGASGGIPVFGWGRWWTVLSAAWLHGSLLHILFNMLWVRQLVPAVSELYGAGRMIMIYTMASVVGFFVSSFAGAFFTVLPLFLSGATGITIGASASIFGLLGALVYYGRRTGSSMVGRQAWGYAGALFVFGLLLPGVDNWGHLGGFVGGYGMSHWLDPLKPERIDHIVGGLASLVLAALAIAASVVHTLWFIR